MALTVEDGTAKSDADTYASLDAYQAYLTNVGLSASGDDTTDEQNLRRARQFLDRSYSWKGYPTTETQALAWPRYISEYVDGYPVDSDEVPQAILDAQCEMAYLVQGGADPFATITGGAVKRKREKVDVIERETEYADGTSVDRSSYVAVDQLVGPYVTGKAGGRVFSVATVRA